MGPNEGLGYLEPAIFIYVEALLQAFYSTNILR